jgi:hypothetical protein
MKPPASPTTKAMARSRLRRRYGRAAVDEGAHHEPRAAQQERRAENRAGNVVDVVPVAALEQLDDVDAADRRRNRAEREPEGEAGVDVPENAVAPRADRLEDRAVQDVRAYRDNDVEVEEEHENGRHQAAAAHPREPDEQPDQESRERELPGHLPGAACAADSHDGRGCTRVRPK